MPVDSSNIYDVVERLLKSKFKIERDKGALQLSQYLQSLKQDNDSFESSHVLVESFLHHLISSNTESEWEPVQGCLLGLKCIVENLYDEFILAKTTQLRNCAQNLLIHDEVRVRLAAGRKSILPGESKICHAEFPVVGTI